MKNKVFQVKGNLWSITLHTFGYWKRKRTEESDPIPLFAINVTRPYTRVINNVEYEAVGTYLFPIVYRRYKRKMYNPVNELNPDNNS